MKIRYVCALVVSAVIGGFVGLGTSVYAARDDAGTLPLDDLRTFTDAFDRIRAAYVNPIDDETLFNNAIKGMLSGLDPHSVYLEPEAFKDLQVSTSGEFGGLGIEVGMEDGYVKVVSPIDDTPAAKAGILAGDLIIKLDDKPVKGLSLMEAVDLMRGKPGEDIDLTIVRKNTGRPLQITVTRAVIKVQSVKSRNLEDDYGYIRVAQFQVNTGGSVVDALEKLHKENDDLKGIVLDLRNNPGGVLQSSVEVADAFLTDGLIVYTKGRIANSDFNFDADSDDPSKGVPLVVLINGGSASASEIVAGALQDQKRAIVMGTNSFGKGSVQTVLPLSNDRALKLTTALYYTPNGRSIQAQGIEPDIRVELATLTKLDVSGGYKEADLDGHLENGNGDSSTQADKANKFLDAETPVEEKELSDSDYQLYEALNLLKGLHIVNLQKQPDS